MQRRHRPVLAASVRPGRDTLPRKRKVVPSFTASDIPRVDRSSELLGTFRPYQSINYQIAGVDSKKCRTFCLSGEPTFRIFAAFEAALRSSDRDHFNDPERETRAATMIDQLGALKHISVRNQIRDEVHRVRRIRNYWAHDSDEKPDQIPIDRVRGLLQAYLDRFPKSWG